MNIKEKIINIRSYPNKLNLKREFIFSSIVLLVGLIMGFAAKVTDSISIIGHIGTEIGIWVFAATLIAAYSRYPISAAINATIFFLGMLASYYSYAYFVLGFFSKSYFLVWFILSLTLVPLGGFIAWFSKGKGIISIISAALPISLLFAHGYPCVYVQLFDRKITLGMSIIFALILNLVLPKKQKSKLIVLVISIIIAVLVALMF